MAGRDRRQVRPGRALGPDPSEQHLVRGVDDEEHEVAAETTRVERVRARSAGRRASGRLGMRWTAGRSEMAATWSSTRSTR